MRHLAIDDIRYVEMLEAMRHPNDDWRAEANCRGYDPAIFFPQAISVVPPEAAAVCDACAVRGDCLAFAVHYREAGVWGSTTARQRERLRRRRASTMTSYVATRSSSYDTEHRSILIVHNASCGYVSRSYQAKPLTPESAAGAVLTFCNHCHPDQAKVRRVVELPGMSP